MTTVTSEKNKMLAFGEKLRENPKSIWLSVPVLGAAILLGKLIGDKEMEAGGSGHLGLSFRLLYKHHWKQTKLLDIAYELFANAARIGVGNGQPSVRMAMGGIAMEKGDNKKALGNYFDGFNLAKKQKDLNQAAFLQSHMGIAQIKLDDLSSAKKNISEAMRRLSQALKKQPNSLYLQVWMSNSELGMSEWYLAAGDKKNAKVWAEKVAKRAKRWELKTREQDAKNLLKRITAACVVLIASQLKPLGLLFNRISVW